MNLPIRLSSILFIAALLVFTGSQTVRSAGECGGADEPCKVATGSYHLAVPPQWDGKTPLPVVMFLHGWKSSGRAFLKNRRFVGQWLAGNVILLLPNSQEAAWAHVGSPASQRDELAFFDSVIADVQARYPVIREKLWVAGFSQGGAMTWDLACYRGQMFSGFVAVSGAFWLPMPDRCATAVHLRHLHGTADRVVPIRGRSLGDKFFQGNIFDAFDVMKKSAECGPQPARVAETGDGRCDIWSNCNAGWNLQICINNQGHRGPDGWIGRALDYFKNGS